MLRLQSLGLVIAQTDLLWGDMKSKKEVFSFYITDTGKNYAKFSSLNYDNLEKISSNRIRNFYFQWVLFYQCVPGSVFILCFYSGL